MPVRHPRALKRNHLCAALIAALVLPTTAAFAQDNSSSQSSDSGTTNLDKVSVVGSRIKRAEIEGPAPVTVITRADIEREGFNTVADMLQTLTQNTSASFTGDLAVTGFTPNAQVVNLRNLGPGYTLTLVNGRRPAQYPSPYNRDNNVVNIRAIPSAAVERVEVLTGGASAIYGSDAIAGVVNIVLREQYEGNSVQLTTGTTSNGGGDSVTLEYTGGRAGDRWSAVYSFQFGSEEPVFASQRDWLSDSRRGPKGPQFTNPSLSLATLNFNPRTGVLGSSVYYPGQDNCDAFGYTTVTTPTRGRYCGSFTQPASRSISNKNQFYTAYGYGTFDLNDNLQLFASGSFYKSDAESSSGTEFWSTSSDQFMRSQAGAQLTGYYDRRFNSPTFLQRVLNPFEVGGSDAVTTEYDEKSYDIMAGVRGDFADRFDWEASVAYSRYDYEATRPKLLSKSVHDYFLGPQLGWRTVNGVTLPEYELNLDRWNTPMTPEQYRSMTTTVANTAKATSATFNFNVSGDLFELPAGAVGFAGVLEAGRQTTDLNSDPRTSPTRPLDDQTVFGLGSAGRTKGERNRYALGVEFRVPILDSLSAQIAGRYDKYDDITAVDDAVTSMFGLEWRPFSSLLLRASYATSFRAPDMQQVFAEGAASYANSLDRYSCRAGTGPADALGPRTIAQCNVSGDPTIYQMQTVVAGNTLLEEEKGKSFGAGFVWDIMEGMSMSVDYYRIKLEDQALQLAASTLLDNEANCRLGVKADGSPYEHATNSVYCQNVYALVTRQGGSSTGVIQRINSAYINAALTDTSGIDATYKYRFDTDRLGTFRLDLGYSLVLTDKYKQYEQDELIDYRDEPSRNSRSRARGSLNWSKGDWSATVFGTRFGTARSSALADGVDSQTGRHYSRRLAPFMLYNLQVSKRFGDNVSADFTVVNVTDNQYRFDVSNTGYPFFDPYVGADPLGRRFYLTLKYRF